MFLQLISVPVVGALIGWITNVLAIKMIFRPHQPLVIPVLNYKIQGLIPKRRKEIAFNIGQVIEKELLSFEDVVLKLKENGVQQKIVKSAVYTISQRVDERIPAIVPSTIKKMLINLVEDISWKEVSLMVDRLLKQWDQLGEEVDFARIVEEKINGFDLLSLERIVLMIASKELHHIEILGAVLGFVIGAIQSLIFWSVNSGILNN
ncbi:MAG: DUF445 domain-containing protein [Bacillota bacterium]|jgi:uncharacterized membrane protein YheB (UPF0754 family)